MSDEQFFTSELVSRGRRTGVIVGVRGPVTSEQAQRMIEQLEERFPRVTFAIVDGGSSIAFEWDGDDE